MKKIYYPPESSISIQIPSFEKGIDSSVNENLLSMNYAVDLKNFSFSDGGLKDGLGFDNFFNFLTKEETLTTLKNDINAIGSLEKVFHFYIYNQETNTREDKLILVNSQHKIYYINIYDTEPVLQSLRNITFSSSPLAVRYRLNGEDVIILTSETDNMVVWNGKDQPYQVLDAPRISSMALHYERLFVTVDGEKNSIWFSDDLDPTNWSLSLEDAGFIQLLDERGALLKVVSFCDYVYIFREYGISRLSAYGNQNNFSVSNLFVSSGKIYAESVCVCGDVIMFLASDGLYKFDGISTVKILDNISKNISNINKNNLSACYYNGSYFLACKYKFYDSNDSDLVNNYNNSLIEIDIDTNKLKNITYGVEIQFITTFQCDKISGVLVLAKTKEDNNFTLTKLSNSCKFLNMNLCKEWLSPISSVGNVDNHKTLKRIYVETSNPINIDIYTENKTYTLSFTKSNKSICKRVNIPLHKFRFKIRSSSTNCLIHSLKFVFNTTQSRA